MDQGFGMDYVSPAKIIKVGFVFLALGIFAVILLKMIIEQVKLCRESKTGNKRMARFMKTVEGELLVGDNDKKTASRVGLIQFVDTGEVKKCAFGRAAVEKNYPGTFAVYQMKDSEMFCSGDYSRTGCSSIICLGIGLAMDILFIAAGAYCVYNEII